MGERPATGRVAGLIVIVLIGLSYVGAVKMWPRFLEGLAQNMCSDAHCIDKLFRRFAIPVGSVALLAATCAGWFAARGSPRRNSQDLVIGSTISLAVALAIFGLSEQVSSWLFLSAGLSATLLAPAIWRASGGGWVGAAALAAVAPWPFVGFALGYPAR